MTTNRNGNGGRTPRVVVVRRATQLEQVVARHGTKAQAQFFLETRGQSIDELERRHGLLEDAMAVVAAAIPVSWRRTTVDRDDLDRFLFAGDDIVVAVGQDGLVANVAKYLSGQPVVGINPDPSSYDGVLVRHPPQAIGDLLGDVAGGRCDFQRRTMVEAHLDGAVTLRALNEVFIGHASHQSARYRIRRDGTEARHSSSGLIVATGTGATGWARSIHRQRRCEVTLPRPEEADLVYFVREAFPSVATSTELTEGAIPSGESIEVVSEMNDGGVVFGDGIEADRIELSWGRTVAVRRADAALMLVE